MSSNIKQQLEDLQRQILDLQRDLPDSPIQSELQRLQRELRNLQQSPQRARPRLTIVNPTPPEVQLTPNEQAVWTTFFHYHRALLQYAGGGYHLPRDQWLHLVDVAADITTAIYSGGQPIMPDFNPPTAAGLWGWDGRAQNWALVPFSNGVTDGSNALPGQVGEWMGNASPVAVPVPLYLNGGTPNFVQLASIILTPGDWDVWGDAALGMTEQIAGPIVVAQAVLSTVLGLPNLGYGSLLILQNDALVAFSALAANRINVTVNTPVYITASLAAVDPADVALTGVCYAYIQARRMR